LQTKLWNKYVWKKQTVSDLAKKYKKSKSWVGKQLDQVQIKVPDNSINPQPIVIIADSTFFDRTYGITVLREPNLKKNLHWQEIINENSDVYWKGRKELEKQGFTIQAVVVDGKKCLKSVFLDLPIQMCHFHQTAIITGYLTTLNYETILPPLAKGDQGGFVSPPFNKGRLGEISLKIHPNPPLKKEGDPRFVIQDN